MYVNRILLVLVLAAATVFAACGSSSDGDATPTPTVVRHTPSATFTPEATPSPGTTTAPTATPAQPSPTEPAPTDTATAVPTEPPTSTATEPPPPTATEPPAGGPAEEIRYLPTDQPVIALTFDAGSDPGYAEMILDVLQAEGVKASFGLTGNWASQNPDTVRRIVAEGHDLINHTWSHRSWTGVSDGLGGLTTEERRQEVTSTEQILEELTGEQALPYFRSPYGDYDASVQADLGTFGYRYNLLWAIDTRGWAGATADEIVQRVLGGLAPGAVVVLHVGSASQDGPALESLIQAVRDAGYGFTGISEWLP